MYRTLLILSIFVSMHAEERQLLRTIPIPVGTTATTSFDTEAGKGPALVIDGNAESAYAPKQGTARADKPASIYLRFASPVADCAGVVLGRGDKFGNYVWKRFEFYADSNGNGTYDVKVGEAKGGDPGRKRFAQILPQCYGLELRAVEQKIGGAGRCFVLNEIEGIVAAEVWNGGPMQVVIEDFEDFTTWRTWGVNTGQPKNERFYGGYGFLAGARRHDVAYAGQGVGVFRFTFTGDKGPFYHYATRGAMIPQEGVVEAITFMADHKSYGGRIHFEMVDGRGKKFRTPDVALDKEAGWQVYRIDCIQALAEADGPVYLKHIFYERDDATNGEFYLDDITLVGLVDRSQRLDIQPVYAGIFYDPKVAVVPRYRLRNALDRHLQGELHLRLFRSSDPDHVTAVCERTVTFSLPPFAADEVAVDLGKLPYDHYEAVLTAATPDASLEAVDPIAVFVPNGKRINTSPMWFGSMHHGDWVSAIENDWRFDEFVVPLGMDCYRTGRPSEREVDHGLLCAAGFGGMPEHLRKPEDKKDNRGAPNDYEAYYEWCKEEARRDYLPYADKLLSIEFYNEPDLPEFCYLPEIDEFEKMHRVFSSAFKEVIPGVQIGTGSVTVGHAKEKKNFTSRMFTELIDSYDVAVWHAHGPLTNYITRHRQVEAYLKKAGVPESEWKLGNSEAAAVSWHDASGRLDQAITLVQKMGWAKAQKSSLFYIWFTTGDIIDPQTDIRRNENWGLFDDQQRCKPSGQAFNEIVRQLANTEGLGEVNWGSHVQACAYRSTDGKDQIYLIWPQSSRDPVSLPMACSAPLTITTCFGRSETVNPVDGRLVIQSDGFPQYIRLPASADIKPLLPTPWISVPETIAAAKGADVIIPITIAASGKMNGTLLIQAHNGQGRELATATVAVQSGQTSAGMVVIPSADCSESILVSISGEGIHDLRAVAVMDAIVVPRLAKIADEMPEQAATITVDTKEAIRDLVFDPSTPLWADANDLSAAMRIAHDGTALHMEWNVRDQSHHPGPAGKDLWNGDSIQMALFVEGKHLEFGLSTAEGGSSWVWISPDSGTGKPLDVAISAKREGPITRYRVTLPFAQLGCSAAPGTAIRCTWLVNEDDNRGRVRLLTWFDGIHSGKDPSRFGSLVLE